MNELTLGALAKYSPIIGMLPEQLKNNLIVTLDDLRKLGVQEYGRRIIYENGRSSILTTSDRWIEAFNSEQLKSSMILHMSNEVLQVKKNHLNLITRSSDKITNEYLRALDYLGLNNSLVKYHFFKHHLEISYFVADKNDVFTRDLFLNKISLLESLEEKLLPCFLRFQSSNIFKNEIEMLVTNDVVDVLFKNSCKYFNIHDITGDELGYKEISYLAYLGFECSNRYIAKSLGISESTVKLDISNLKAKLNAENREELVAFANTSKIKQLVKVMNII